MKKVLFYFLALFACAACTTDNDTPVTPDESVQVTFNVSSLDVDVQPMHARTRAAVAAGESSLTEIRYWIYNLATNKVQVTGTQTAASSGDDFGKVTIKLPVGTYKVMFWGLNGKNSTGYLGSPDMTYSGNESWFWTMYNKDTFYWSNLNLEITNATKTKEISLSRINGALVFDFEDTEISPEIGKIEVKWYSYEKYYFESGTPYGGNTFETTNLNFSESGIDETTFYTFQYSDIDLSITLYDTGNRVIGTTKVPGVGIIKNRRTIIRGNLMDVFAGRELSVSVNEDWGTDNVITLQ